MLVWLVVLVVHGLEWWLFDGITNAFVALQARAIAVTLSRRIMSND